MEIGFDDVDADDLLGPINYWAKQAGILNNLPVTYGNVSRLRKEVFDKIMFELFSQDSNSLRFQKIMTNLAFTGTSENERTLLEKDIEELKLTPNGVIIQTGFGNKVGIFWKKHWKKVVIGAIIVALVVTVSVGVSAAAAGSQLCKSKENKKAPKKFTNHPEHKKLTEKNTSSIAVDKLPKSPSFLEHGEAKNSPKNFDCFTFPEKQTAPESFFPFFSHRNQGPLSTLDKSLPSFKSPDAAPSLAFKTTKPMTPTPRYP